MADDIDTIKFFVKGIFYELIFLIGWNIGEFLVQQIFH